LVPASALAAADEFFKLMLFHRLFGESHAFHPYFA
jgi:hypothetical protein